MKALITGASGFVGRHLTRHLLEMGDVVTGTILHGENSLTGIRSTELDVTDSAQCDHVVRSVQPDVIYHLAGVAFVPDAERDPKHAHLVNVVGVEHILRAVKESVPSCRIVVISSSEVYGDFTPAELPLRESRQPQPKHQYGLTKYFAECSAERARRVDSANVVVLRAFNHIGPGQRGDFVVSSFAKQLAEMKLGQRPPVISVGNLSARRDFTDVRDIVRAYHLASMKGTGVINLCSGVAVSIQNILEQLIDLSGLTVSITVDPSRLRPVDIPELRGSNQRAWDELAWRPEIPLSRSLSDAYTWWTEKLKG